MWLPECGALLLLEALDPASEIESLSMLLAPPPPLLVCGGLVGVGESAFASDDPMMLVFDIAAALLRPSTMGDDIGG